MPSACATMIITSIVDKAARWGLFVGSIRYFCFMTVSLEVDWHGRL